MKCGKKRYKKRLQETSKADVCVYEISYPSFGVGQLAQEAIREGKPVILLYYKGNPPHFFTGTAEVEKRVQLLEYDENNIENVLIDSLEIAEELLTTRFTMLMPANLNKYLTGIKKRFGLSRSEYIRKLLQQDMSKQK